MVRALVLHRNCVVVLTILSLIAVGQSSGASTRHELAKLTDDAVSSDQATATQAIESLRALGPQGLAAFREVHAIEIGALAERPACLCAADSLERRVAQAYDRIAGQRDATTSGLFWFTDIAAAKDAAVREGKPILSLHMLGKLTDELSCANSRFFRTTLYSDRMIAEYLRQAFVLHWETVRPVPKITVDFGDGRRLERTITGNSAHFVLDRSGRVIDVVPGLYAPQAFLSRMRQAAGAAIASERCGSPGERSEFLARYHRKAEQRLAAEILAVTAGIPVSRAASMINARASVDALAKGRVDAVVALDRAAPKARVERPLVKLVTDGQLQQSAWSRTNMPASAELATSVAALALEPISNQQLDKLAALPVNQASLSPESERLVRAKMASLPSKHFSTSLNEVQKRAIADLARLTSLDTARNEYDFHRRIHNWLSDGQNPDVKQLNDRIYAELFLTPLVDPWMGLLNTEAFSAIDAYGVAQQP